MAPPVNCTLRVRAISEVDLAEILELLEAAAKRVIIVDSHDTREQPN